MKKKIIYLSLTADNLHHGHIKLIQEAKKFGLLIVGLLTDQAVSKNKRIPLLNYDQREMIIKNHFHKVDGKVANRILLILE